MKTASASPSRLIPLLLVLLVPGGVLAAPGCLRSSPLPLPGTAPRAALRLTDAPAATPAPNGGAQAGRVLAGLGLGAVMGLVGVAGGYIAGFGGGDFEGAAVGIAVGAGLGTSLGAYWGGQLAGGEGEWFAGSLLGSAAGTALGCLIGYLAFQNVFGIVAFAPPLALAGAVIGYEFSEHSGTQPTVRPQVSLTPRGGSLGLAGTF